MQWRHSEELGLAFSDSVAAGNAAPLSSELGERVARLESEVRALRCIVRQLKSELPGGNDEAA